jgi:rubredoxin
MAKKTLNIEEVRARGLEKGVYLNSEIYSGNRMLLSWSCVAEWHPFPSTWSDISQDHSCPTCAGNKKLTIEQVRKVGFEKGSYLNSEIYQNSSTKLDWNCIAEWHNFKMTYADISQDHGCPYCAGVAKLTVEYVYRVGFEKGFYLNSEIYTNSKTLLSWSCVAEWHSFKASWSNINNGDGCPGCRDNLGWQTDFYYNLLKFIPNLLKEQKVLKNKKFKTDIWDPVNNQALELDGDYWHTLPKTIEIDIRKNQEYADAGIKLLRIKYSEWKKNPELSFQQAVHFFCHVLSLNLRAV